METTNLDFSFSGLKTAVLRFVREKSIDAVAAGAEPGQIIKDLAASFQDKVVRSLLSRLKEGVRRHHPRTIIIAGGVACNRELRARSMSQDFGAPVYFPSPKLTTDNAAMIAAAGYPKLLRGEDDGLDITASAALKIDNLSLEGYERPLKARYKL
jgi:N6-L-threonylcarbamoyladenine synthase